ncbi:threonine aldolase [Sinomonas atrocyanea]|uniref:Threonine aldolase n=1 Tax=Sinomonas atrocyanea TaxID=37927 RepID=A0A126ZZE6_9MICC|nr:threonine aldolase [Sinomonas atrocyanea]
MTVTSPSSSLHSPAAPAGWPLHDSAVRGFASDNYSGAHPEVLAALASANGGHQVSYGQDEYTARLQAEMEALFGEGVQAYPVFNGTGANVVSLQSLVPRWGAVVCATTAHINVDENGAPERVGGLKLLGVPTSDGKLTPELIDREAWGWGTSTAPSRWPSRSPRRPSWARDTRSRSSAPSPSTPIPAG